MSLFSSAAIDSDYLRDLRTFELTNVIKCILPKSRILEIGAGAGWQAQALSDQGFSVQAIDIEESRYHRHCVWDVVIYDGHNIPFPDESFDVIFSSNVLEHIPHLEVFQEEIKRVLKPSGLAIHVLPSAAWRFWTNITHYPYVLKVLLCGTWLRSPFTRKNQKKAKDSSFKGYKLSQVLVRAFWPSRHGERGNSITEHYFFSRWYWRTIFRKTGWHVESLTANNIFYTGNVLLGTLLDMNVRQKLSFLLGSSSMTYVVKPLRD